MPRRRRVPKRPLLPDPKFKSTLVTGVLLIVLGILFLITGLLGELVVRTYYESQSKQIYYIRNVYHRGTRPHDDT